MTSRHFEAVGGTTAQWGEGPVWSGSTLYWVDIEGGLVIAFDPASASEQVWNVGERVGTVVPRAAGGLAIAGDSGFRLLNTDAVAPSALCTPLADPEQDKPDNRFNDGKCDPAGRFWAGTMHLQKPRRPTGALYRLDPDGSVHTMLEHVTVSNGIAWNRKADTMFYIDTPTHQIVAFDYEVTSGDITNRRLVSETGGCRGVPDGMAIDEHDNLWVAMCHGGQIRCFDSSSGETLEVIDCPTLEVTAPAFGGAELSDFYVTTGQSEVTKDDPLAGRLLVAEVGVKGQAAFAFAG